jgi:protease I
VCACRGADRRINRNWVTSRQPSDIPAFNREMIRLFAEHQGKSQRTPAHAATGNSASARLGG